MEPTSLQPVADRVAARLAALDLDDDEEAFLRAMLLAAPLSASAVGGEVEGFAFGPGGGPSPSVGLSLAPSVGGWVNPTSSSHDDESPKETVTFEYGGLLLSYGRQSSHG
jgi:hypothetical protein